jgi:hypothetical protein
MARTLPKKIGKRSDSRLGEKKVQNSVARRAAAKAKSARGPK